MPIPTFEDVMLPLLKLVEDRQEHSLRESIEHMYKVFSLTEEEKKTPLPSGLKPVIDNRVGWAATYLRKAGLLESTRRSFFKITTRGLDALKAKPSDIRVKDLKKYPEFLEFKPSRTGERIKPQEAEGTEEQTPREILENGYQAIRSSLEQDILAQVKKTTPEFFESLVVKLLVKMGYGGSEEDAAKAIGATGDEGVDGLIKEDKLGLDTIYIQAKKWENTVGRPEIQKFAGALQGQKAKKGIFITTSNFSKEAAEYVSKIDTKIVLINGQELAKLLIDNDVGVSTEATYDVKKIDLDYFSEE